MDDPNRLPPEVADALANGNVIEAIRLLRQQRNLGLAEAKALIDAMQKQGNVKVHMKTTARTVTREIPRRPGLSPGEVPRRNIGAIVALLLLVGLILVGVAAYLRLA